MPAVSTRSARACRGVGNEDVPQHQGRRRHLNENRRRRGTRHRRSQRRRKVDADQGCGRPRNTRRRNRGAGRRCPSPGSGVAAAKKAGVRLASQEVVLCPDLLVLENVALAHPELFAAGRTWRRDIARRFDEQLAAVFPGRRISAHRRTGALSLTDLQIVQLTIATMPTSVPIRTLILDEPTSALTSDLATASVQLRQGPPPPVGPRRRDHLAQDAGHR